ncbi:unnamed protein product [Peronospora farinosa]|uniref:BTB domain-containing protein n=1 Tax=Peronospora farinosa TaxID=134698 RepID=A0AAV0UF12_9STRA|nr:unnamed protein product [Peronospora farinosa]
MTRRKDGKENEDAHIVTNDDDLLDASFTERNVSSDNDENLTIFINWGKNSMHTKQTMAANALNVFKNVSPFDKKFPVLSRITSQRDSFDEHLRSLDHTVGRTRVPWHSKSISDLRDPETRPVRIVAFDVGGKLFRCKESLIAKYPHKRLNQIIMCGCGKIGCLDDAFFIDRNPQHFEMILDWYRTGKLVRQRNVNEEAFKDDAIYFDLLEELFSSTQAGDPWPTSKVPTGLTTRRRSVNDVDAGQSSTKRVSMFANISSPPACLHLHKKTTEAVTQTETESPQDVELPTTTDDRPLHFFRRERRVLTPTSIPLVFMIRKFEQLLVESVAGRGKLMVCECDATGMQTIDVPEAVLFDSDSHFYRKDAHAQLQHNALLPGDHVYTFWMEENATDASFQTSAPPALDIAFKLLFTFDSVDRLTTTMEVELMRTASECSESDPHSENSLRSFSFMPRSLVKRDLEVTLPPDACSKRTIPLKLNKQLPSLSKTEGKVVKRGNQREGAAIMHGARIPHP